MTKESNRNPIREMLDRFYAKFVKPLIEYFKSLIRLKLGEGSPTGPAPVTYKFKFRSKEYAITKPNLDTAISGNKITASENVMGLNVKITLSDDEGYKKDYWTNQTNLSNMVTNPRISKPL